MAFEFRPLSSVLYRIEGGWEEVCADIMQIWGALTREDMVDIEARHDRLVARLKMRYGVSTKEAEKMIEQKLGGHKDRQEPQAPA